MVKKLSNDPTRLKKTDQSSQRLRKNAKTKPIQSEIDLPTIQLPKPSLKKGLTVSAALKKRCTSRTISDKKLSLQMFSNILWAAGGINRKKGPFKMCGRTSATASNSQEIDIYVTLPVGVYLYEPQSHTLQPVISGDYRSSAVSAGQQGAGAVAPVRLIYIVDIEKFKNAGFQEPGLQDPETQKAYYYVDTGLIAGNVYLYAGSQGLGAWFHNCDKTALAKVLPLRASQRILFGQTVGKLKK